MVRVDSPSEAQMLAVVEERHEVESGVQVHGWQVPLAHDCIAAHGIGLVLSPSAAHTLRVVAFVHVDAPGVQLHGTHAPPEQLWPVAQVTIE